MKARILFKHHCVLHTPSRLLHGRPRVRPHSSAQYASVWETHKCVRSKQKSAVEVLEGYLEHIQNSESDYHSFLKVDAEGAKHQVWSEPEHVQSCKPVFAVIPAWQELA